MSEQEQSEPPAQDIWDAKLRIMEQVGYVRKTGRIKKKDTGAVLYTFAGEGDLLRAIRPLLVEEAVTMTCVGIDAWPGAPTQLVRAKYHFVFRHQPSKTEDMVFVLGEGGDGGDKCCPKANTIAAKYALRIWLQIETGDDPDRQVQDGRDGAKKQADKPPAKESTSFEKAKAAIKKAPDVKTLDRFLAAAAGKGYSEAETKELEGIYVDRKNSLGGRTEAAK
jgi:hypothetical protein